VTAQAPILSTNPADAECFGVVTEYDPDDAADMGAFREDALSAADAWASQDGEGDADGN
jgi:hypothetical protein